MKKFITSKKTNAITANMASFIASYAINRRLYNLSSLDPHTILNLTTNLMHISFSEQNEESETQI